MIIKHRKKIEGKQLIIFLCLMLSMGLLGASLFAPSSFIMSLASSGLLHYMLRGIILVALVAVLASHPPRSLQFRIILGALSSIIVTGACISMMDYKIGVLDAILYLEVSIILAIEAIENKKAPVRLSRPQPLKM